MGTEEPVVAKVIQRCLAKTDSQAWIDLVCLLQPVFARMAYRVIGEWGLPRSAVEMEDIVQESFLKLAARSKQILPRVPLTSDQAALAYFKVMGANCAHDYLKARYAEKRGVDRTTHVEDAMAVFTSIEESGRLDRNILFAEINAALKADVWERSVFWLYYRQGFTAKEISEIPGCSLGAKGVESLIHRLTVGVRTSLDQSRGGARNFLKGGSAPESS